MISVAVLRGGAAAGYYVQERGCEHALVRDLARTGDLAPPAALDPELAYYVNGRELPGRWIGGGSRALRLGDS